MSSFLRRHGVLVIIAAAAALSVGWLTFSIFRGKPVSESLGVASSPWGAPREHVQLQREVDSVPMSDGEGIRSQLLLAVGDDIADPAGIVSEDAALSLVDTIQGYMDAWSAASADTYMKLVSREPTRWIDPDNRVWARIEHALQERHGITPDRSRPEEAMRILVDDWMLGNGNRWVAIGRAGRGARIFFDRATSESGLRTALLAERLGIDEYSFTTGGGAHSLRMRKPLPSPARLLRDHGFIDYAQVIVQARTEGGKVGYWHSTWYYDPSSRRWLNAQSVMESFHGLPMVY